MNELAKQEQKQIEQVKVTKEDIKNFLCPQASDKEIFMAMGIINSYGLNPFKREVHIIKYGTSPAQVVVGYEVYLKRAERTGVLNGWNVVLSADNTKATVTIYRKDWQYPFVWEVDRAEFDKKQSTWAQIKNFMLKKVAIAQAFRICFSDELGGYPYTPEEQEIINQSTSPFQVEKPPETVKVKIGGGNTPAQSPQTSPVEPQATQTVPVVSKPAGTVETPKTAQINPAEVDSALLENKELPLTTEPEEVNPVKLGIPRITEKQWKLMLVEGAKRGLSFDDVKNKFFIFGVTHHKDIKVEDFDKVFADIKKLSEVK